MKSFSVSAPPVEPIQPKSSSSDEIVAELKSTGRGWTEDMRSLLRLPQRLFLRKLDAGSFYSADFRFGISDILSRIESGSISARDTDYGIALYSKGGSVYFVLADMSRRIIVREKLFSVHDKPPERDWKEIGKNIREALSAAEGERENAVVFDGMIRKVRILHP